MQGTNIRRIICTYPGGGGIDGQDKKQTRASPFALLSHTLARTLGSIGRGISWRDALAWVRRGRLALYPDSAVVVFYCIVSGRLFFFLDTMQ